MKGKRRRTKKKRVSFSKLLLLLESGIVLYTTYEGFALAKFAVASGFMGTLPWIATMVTERGALTARAPRATMPRQRRKIRRAA